MTEDTHEFTSELKDEKSERFDSQSEPNVPLEPDSTPIRTRSPSADAFGLVLHISSVQPIWQLPHLFCYRAVWQGDRKELSSDASNLRREVVLTIATGPAQAF